MGRKAGKKKRRNPSKGSRRQARPSSSAIETAMASADDDEIDERFDVGDRVYCVVEYEYQEGIDSWCSGTVVELRRDDATVEEEQLVPFHVYLDDGRYICPPDDMDDIYKLSPDDAHYQVESDDDRGGELRFGVGDRVECWLGNHPDEWFSGTVVKLWHDYESVGISVGMRFVAPYQIRLDRGGLTWAPVDNEYCCRAASFPPIEVEFAEGARVECKSAESDSDWRPGIVFRSNEDWMERHCTPYFIKFDDGKCEEFCGPQDCIKESFLPTPVADLESDDDDLFALPPPMPDCPICFDRLSSHACINLPCCGSDICAGCYDRNMISALKVGDHGRCPFCRMAIPEDGEEEVALRMQRLELDDAENIFSMGCCYFQGNGLPANRQKAFDLFLRAAELGSMRACSNVACAYAQGDQVEKDEIRARHYFEKGAKLGGATARYNLGWLEFNEGHLDVALKHWKMSAVAGCGDSLEKMREGYKKGILSKEEYANILRESQKNKDEEAGVSKYRSNGQRRE